MDSGEKFLWKYAVKAKNSLTEEDNSTIEEYGFIVADDTFVSAVEYIEKYYGEDLEQILHLECIQYAGVFRAKDKECWEILSSDLSWNSELLEESI